MGLPEDDPRATILSHTQRNILRQERAVRRLPNPTIKLAQRGRGLIPGKPQVLVNGTSLSILVNKIFAVILRNKGPHPLWGEK